MHKLSNEQLQEAFNSAIKLNLSKEFILLLANELNARYMIGFTPKKKTVEKSRIAV